MVLNVDLSRPRFDQNTYIGRLKHFLYVTNPLNSFASEASLAKAKDIVTKYLNKEDVPVIDEEKLWAAKHLYDSAYHPETGELQPVYGRMAFQVPGNTLIGASMLTFCKSPTAVIFWQWINQTFNAVVNYTNQSGGSEITDAQLYKAYFGATSAAVTTAVGLKALTRKLNPNIAVFIPFFAVAAANCINVPMMRSHELRNGIKVYDDKNNELTTSKKAAFSAISQVVLSRVLMGTPALVLTPCLVLLAKPRFPILQTVFNQE